jgi:hypothetical protein
LRYLGVHCKCYTLAPPRREKGKPVARRGRKATGLSTYERWPGYRTAVGPRVGPSPRVVGGREPHPYSARKERGFTLFIVDPHRFSVGHLEVS